MASGFVACCASPLHWQVHISYLEIYNETGYDLLDKDREVKALEDLTRVRKALPQGFRGLMHSLAFRMLGLRVGVRFVAGQ